MLGGQAAMSIAIGYEDRRHVWPWFNTDRPVPESKCAAIEQATHGRVTCEELRPDIAWHRIKDKSWPWHPKGKPLVDVMPAVES